MYPRDMVCLRNISADTLHKGDTEDDDDDDDDNNNNNNNNNNNMQGNRLNFRPWSLLLRSTKMSRESKMNIGKHIKSTIANRPNQP